jgi:hypothetical protein
MYTALLRLCAQDPVLHMSYLTIYTQLWGTKCVETHETSETLSMRSVLRQLWLSFTSFVPQLLGTAPTLFAPRELLRITAVFDRTLVTLLSSNLGQNLVLGTHLLIPLLHLS